MPPRMVWLSRPRMTLAVAMIGSGLAGTYSTTAANRYAAVRCSAAGLRACSAKPQRGQRSDRLPPVPR